jgi:hypothetical protein
MDNRKILAAIDEQIGRLQQAKQLLGGGNSAVKAKARASSSTCVASLYASMNFSIASL